MRDWLSRKKTFSALLSSLSFQKAFRQAAWDEDDYVQDNFRHKALHCKQRSVYNIRKDGECQLVFLFAIRFYKAHLLQETIGGKEKKEDFLGRGFSTADIAGDILTIAKRGFDAFFSQMWHYRSLQEGLGGVRFRLSLAHLGMNPLLGQQGCLKVRSGVKSKDVRQRKYR